MITRKRVTKSLLLVFILSGLLILEYARETIVDLSERLRFTQQEWEATKIELQKASSESAYLKGEYSGTIEKFLSVQLKMILTFDGNNVTGEPSITMVGNDNWEASATIDGALRSYTFRVRFDIHNSPCIDNLREV